jgi:predicted nucleic acid-binding Zn ribbon protein
MRSVLMPFTPAARAKCKQCGAAVTERGRYWCSDACEEYWVDDSI